MRKNLRTKTLAGFLSLAMVLSGSGINLAASGTAAAADGEEVTELKDVLEAEDIDIRTKWEDQSNVGEEKTVTLSDGSTITVKDNGSMRPELSSQELADTKMGMGINLGNTLEATYTVESKNSITGDGFDKGWGQTATTREYIDYLHTYGINTLRIPVAWSNGDVDDGTYTIRPELLDRVETVANYALDNGMYVIINDHWDNQWWGQFGACKKVKDENGNITKVADEETRQAAWDRYERYWTQISERFKNYSDHLILEGANEELGDRLNDGICANGPAKGYVKPDNAGTDIDVISGNLKTDELYDMTNRINQKFVDVVRGTGGNNAGRFLLIPGYNTNFTDTSDEKYHMPEDIKENSVQKLLLSVHYYTPGDFCLDRPNAPYTTEDQAAAVNYFADLQRFSDEGYGIILGECGVCEPSAVSSSVTQWFYDTFKLAGQYHAVPVLWDTGAYFDRKTPAINYKDIAVFLNTLNGANGSIDTDRVTGGAEIQFNTNASIPTYLDADLWNTSCIHAYAFYQTATWDYRNVYQPLNTLSNGAHSWEYAQASGAELTAGKSEVTDVKLTGDGEYTVSIKGIDLSGANSFKMLGISTDISVDLYPGITATGSAVKFDGKDLKDSPFDLAIKSDQPYYTFMLINVYDRDSSHPLGEENDNQTLNMPAESIEITFQISGLDSVIADIESGNYTDPEGQRNFPVATPTPDPTDTPAPPDSVSSSPDSPAPTDPGSPAPAASDTPAPTNTSSDLADSPSPDTPASNTPAPIIKCHVFTSGNYTYDVSKEAKSGKGVVVLTKLSSKGKKAKKLTVPATVKEKGGKSYTVAYLGQSAFKGASATSITLNKNIKIIPASAFAKCKKLSSLTLKAKLSKVAKNAFKDCTKKIKVKGVAKAANTKLLKKTNYKKFR